MIRGISGKIYTIEELTKISQEYLEELKVVPFHAFTFSRTVDTDKKKANIIEAAAKANHNEWYTQKMSKGYTYGPVVNDDITKGTLTNPNLLPWDELPEAIKEENRRNAKENFALLEGIGYTIVSNEEFVDEIASKSHDNWCRAKAEKGFIWNFETNTNSENGPLSHRDLLPYEVLVDIWPADAEYDQQVALGNIASLQAANCSLKAM